MLVGAGVVLGATIGALVECPCGIGALFKVLQDLWIFVERIQDGRQYAERLSFWATGLIQIMQKFLPEPFPEEDSMLNEAATHANAAITALLKSVENMVKTKKSWVSFFKGREYLRIMEKAEDQVQRAIDLMWKYFEAETNTEVKKIAKDVIVLLHEVGKLEENLADIRAMGVEIKDKIDRLGDKIDRIADKIDQVGDKVDGVGDKVHAVGDKIDGVLRICKESSEDDAKWRAEVAAQAAAQAAVIMAEFAKLAAGIEKQHSQPALAAVSTADKTEIANENARQFWKDNFQQKSSVALEEFGDALVIWLVGDDGDKANPAIIESIQRLKEADQDGDGKITPQELHSFTVSSEFPAKFSNVSHARDSEEAATTRKEEASIKQWKAQLISPSIIEDEDIRRCWKKAQPGQKTELQTKLPWQTILMTLMKLYSPPFPDGFPAGDLDVEVAELKNMIEKTLQQGFRRGKPATKGKPGSPFLLQINTKISWEELELACSRNGGSLPAIVKEAVKRAKTKNHVLKSIKPQLSTVEPSAKSDKNSFGSLKPSLLPHLLPSQPASAALPKDRNAARFIDPFRMEFEGESTVIFNPHLRADIEPPEEISGYLTRSQLKIGTAMVKDPLSPENPYFEVTIEPSDAVQHAVAVGLTAHSIDSQYMPGWQPGSLALHSDDGVVYTGQMKRNDLKISNILGGDTIGCGILFSTNGDAVTVYWTRNGLIQAFAQAIPNAIYPYIGVETHQSAEKSKIEVKLNLAHPKDSSPCPIFANSAVASVVSFDGLERKRSFCQSINQALEEANAGDQIHLAEGIHCLDNNLIITKDISLIGKRDKDEQANSKIFVAYFTEDEDAGPALLFSATGKCLIKDVGIHCFGGDIDRAWHDGGACCILQAAGSLTVSGCILECAQGSGLCIHEAEICTVDGSTLIGPCAKHGISTKEDGLYSLVCTNVKVFNCGLYGVAINNPTKAILTSVEILNCCGASCSSSIVAGVLVKGSNNDDPVRFDNVDIQGCESGVIIANDATVKASNCSVSDCRSYGFHMLSEIRAESPKLDLTGCKFTDIGQFGVRVTQGNVALVSCSFKECRTAVSANGEKSKITIERSDSDFPEPSHSGFHGKDIQCLNGASVRGMFNAGNQAPDPVSPGTPGPSTQELPRYCDHATTPSARVQYNVGDVLMVVGDVKAAKIACNLPYSAAGWVSGMKRYLGETGVILQVKASSVKLKHDDGEEWSWGYEAVKLVKRHEKLDCKPRDFLQVVTNEYTATRAFLNTDAHWMPDMRQYLGKMGMVLEVDTLSVRLQHDDGRSVWWGHAALQKVNRSQIKLDQEFKKGSLYEVIGLINHDQFNGSEVVVVECDANKGLVRVLTAQDRILALKPQNLKILESGSGPFRCGGFHRHQANVVPKQSVRVRVVQGGPGSRKVQTIMFPYNKPIVQHISENTGEPRGSFLVVYKGDRITSETCADYRIEDGDELLLRFTGNAPAHDEDKYEAERQRQLSRLLSQVFRH